MDFDNILDRRDTESIKWHYYHQDVLPMWVADMDFCAPEPVIAALQKRVEHGIFGYGGAPEGLCEAIAKHVFDFQGWTIDTSEINFVSGVVTGFAHAIYSLTEPGDRVLIQTPVYPPILHAPAAAGRQCVHNQLIENRDGKYTIDFDDFERKAQTGVKLFILCNPHNPVGRVFSRSELTRMAEICLENDILICSDEIHSDLIFSSNQHLPIASLAPEVAKQTVTYFAPSKTYNLAGLSTSVYITQNPDLKKRLSSTMKMVLGHPNILGLHAARAAYQDGRPWLKALLAYLEANRDYMVDYVENQLPGVKIWKPQGTFLGWLNCQALGLDSPHAFFLERGKVGFNEGLDFGSAGSGYLRINFGCPRATLSEGLNRMKQALDELQTHT